MAGEIKGVILDDGTHSIDYSSLANKPTIPTKVSDLTNDSGFVTSTQAATDTSYGVVKIDNNSIKVNQQGQLYISINSTEGVEF